MRFLFIALLFTAITTHGQTRIPHYQEDSICEHGEKFELVYHPEINFPAKMVSDDYKIKEYHKAIPDSFKDAETPKWWLYNYYFEFGTYIIGDSLVEVPDSNKLLYKLKDTYYFDINGDGLLDFVHYSDYKSIYSDADVYELFLQQKNGYKMIQFRGFIVDITFNKDGTLDKMKTFKGPCCDDTQCTFYYYSFDKAKNELVITKTEQKMWCQINLKQVK